MTSPKFPWGFGLWSNMHFWDRLFWTQVYSIQLHFIFQIKNITWRSSYLP